MTSHSRASQISLDRNNANHQTILLVEDEGVVREITREVLERQGYCVLEADGAEQAIRMSQDHSGRIDLLLTDVVMPGMNGRDLARQLLMANPALNIAFMSGYAEHELLRKVVVDPAAVYIPKPFTLAALLSGVANAINPKAATL
jgi:hypothetical protein